MLVETFAIDQLLSQDISAAKKDGAGDAGCEDWLLGQFRLVPEWSVCIDGQYSGYLPTKHFGRGNWKY
jgi:type 1 glutamine amidotransferase